MKIQGRPPGWFWLLAIALLAWNVIGLLALLFDPVTGLGDASQLPTDQQRLYSMRPAYAFVGFVTATVAGTLACILLLLRRSAALWLFVISLIGFIAQNVWLFIKPNARETINVEALAFIALILGSIMLGVWLCRVAKQRNWSV